MPADPGSARGRPLPLPAHFGVARTRAVSPGQRARQRQGQGGRSSASAVSSRALPAPGGKAAVHSPADSKHRSSSSRRQTAPQTRGPSLLIAPDKRQGIGSTHSGSSVAAPVPPATVTALRESATRIDPPPAPAEPTPPQRVGSAGSAPSRQQTAPCEDEEQDRSREVAAVLAAVQPFLAQRPLSGSLAAAGAGAGEGAGEGLAAAKLPSERTLRSSLQSRQRRGSRGGAGLPGIAGEPRIAWESSFDSSAVARAQFSPKGSPRSNTQQSVHFQQIERGLSAEPGEMPSLQTGAIPSPTHRARGTGFLQSPADNALTFARGSSARSIGTALSVPPRKRRTVNASVLAVRWCGDPCAPEAGTIFDAAAFAVRHHNGQSLNGAGQCALVAWNVGEGADTRHAFSAAQAAVRVQERLRQCRVPLSSCGLAVATGSLHVTEGPTLPGGLAAHGDAIRRATMLAVLGPLLRCRVVVDDETRARTCSQLVYRPCDVAQVHRPPAPPDVIYALHPEQPPPQQQQQQQPQPPQEGKRRGSVVCRFDEAFLALTRPDGLVQAREAITGYLQEHPGDAQAYRLLRLVLAREAQGKGGEPWVRRWCGWEEPEKGQELPGELTLPPGYRSGDEDIANDMASGPLECISELDVDDTLSQSQTRSFRRERSGCPRIVDLFVGALTDSGILRRYWDKLYRKVMARRRATAGSRRARRHLVIPADGGDRAVSFYLGAGGPQPHATPKAPRASKRRGGLGHRHRSHLLLERAIKELRQDNDKRAPVASSSAPDPPFEVRDHRGNTWHRSSKLLGKGAFGSVYVGMGTDGDLVAMKALPIPQASAASSATHRRRRAAAGGGQGNLDREINDLVAEVRLLSDLEPHNNIVKYHGSAMTAHHVIVIMELLPGGCLCALLRQFGRLPMSSAVRYTKCMCAGLHFLHSQGIVHRDFKPGNVLLQIDGHCKLADFGASASFEEVQGGGVIGTPLYMAPEQARGQACAKSDIWAVGITVCEMLTGKVPYKDAGADDFMSHRFVYQLSQGQVHPIVSSRLPTAAHDFATQTFRLPPDSRPTAHQLMMHRFILHQWAPPRRLSQDSTPPQLVLPPPARQLPPSPKGRKRPQRLECPQEDSPANSPRNATLRQDTALLPLAESPVHGPRSPRSPMAAGQSPPRGRGTPLSGGSTTPRGRGRSTGCGGGTLSCGNSDLAADESEAASGSYLSGLGGRAASDVHEGEPGA